MIYDILSIVLVHKNIMLIISFIQLKWIIDYFYQRKSQNIQI
jgi:hypothetical protein